MKYRQCVLVNGDTRTEAWLDAEVAKPGVRVTLKDSSDPEEWWTIESASKMTLYKSEIKDSHNSVNWYKKDFLGNLGNKE